jgi:ABC-type uncharacterized transport system substrate-binding protein
MATKTILALAVGDPKSSQLIDHPNKLPGVRPYISGLIDGLAESGSRLGTDFVIDYRQNWLDYIVRGKAFTELPPDPALIYAMSTKVMRAAGDYTDGIPIVFPNCSEHGDEAYIQEGRATGFSAQRTQSAGECFNRFFMSVPSLNRVFIPHIDEHDICENALQLVMDAATKKAVEPLPILVKSHADLLDKLSGLPRRAPGTPATIGVHVLPVDLFFGATPEIIKWVQQEKNLPAFFPVTDWVTEAYGGAFGGYGVAQYTCGERTAAHVQQILSGSGPDADQLLSVTEAAGTDFDWAVSRAAATALEISTKIDAAARLL